MTGTTWRPDVLADFEHATLAECRDYFEALRLEGAKAGIADKIVREGVRVAELRPEDNRSRGIRS